MSQLNDIKKIFSDQVYSMNGTVCLDREHVDWLIKQAEKGLTEREKSSRDDRLFFECVKVMQEIKFICQRAKRYYMDEKDIDDILKLLEGKV
ncbi:hypothetical protein ABC970_12780 [Bacillus licheniformis]|uniref:NTP pyrophosphohydrolase MazG putative catalytic core domain-containing protein n=1 Tax=Bacillus paralicheniformis TaxID=1648923 RepID=A0AAW6KJM4_9BACI|nr:MULTISPECIES: hypothetical protein [Bacillus]MBC8621368.1 hypothetical protein [Robertmurraya crescens]MBL7478247.1 hypothetical protein [Bacillus paralicheniformis]MCI4128214.1 hypothetical protein [Bacillus haynesii]MCM3424073.1 hypothetical protein [Bacillus paralicheniformis]MDE1385599.1 hypothetical protein [Bacillus paralicheniformis]